MLSDVSGNVGRCGEGHLKIGSRIMYHLLTPLGGSVYSVQYGKDRQLSRGCLCSLPFAFSLTVELGTAGDYQ